ncbi:MAG: hypothetical protein KKD18_05200 [Nanoarchaeota archaeon]|nr:hypothetical protein [Nanoarchaeota archaeon]MBU0977786.1 hypothetical protein [Nanoarchaeota archaeon]
MIVSTEGGMLDMSRKRKRVNLATQAVTTGNRYNICPKAYMGCEGAKNSDLFETVCSRDCYSKCSENFPGVRK